MGASSRVCLATTCLVLALAGCGGNDEDRSVEATKWCEVTRNINARVEFGDPVIDYDLADEWTEAAPEDIRVATETASRIRRELPKDPEPSALVDAEGEIAEYAKANCPP